MAGLRGCLLRFRMLFSSSAAFQPHLGVVIALRSVRTSSASFIRPPSLASDQPMPPKKPPNAYNLFVKEKLAENREERLNKGMTEQFRDIASMWRNMSDHDKEKYRELYSMQKEEWDSEYQAFLEGVPNKDVFLKQMKAQKRARRRKLKNLRERKGQITFRKLSAYNVFMRDQLTGVPGNEVKAHLYEASKNWKMLSPAKKEEYAREAREIWEHNMRKLESKHKEQDV